MILLAANSRLELLNALSRNPAGEEDKSGRQHVTDTCFDENEALKMACCGLSNINLSHR